VIDALKERVPLWKKELYEAARSGSAAVRRETGQALRISQRKT